MSPTAGKTTRSVAKSAPAPFAPDLTRIDDPAIRSVLRLITDQVASLRGRPGDQPTVQGHLNLTQHRVTNVEDPLAPQDAVTKAYADTHYGPTVIRAQLQAGGTAPLNLFNLPGAGSGAILYGTHTQRQTTDATSEIEGALFFETDRQAVYINERIGGTLTWYLVTGHTTGHLTDLPPDMTAVDAGFLHDATDYDRQFRWTGANWSDSPGQTPRQMVVYRNTAAVPPGWALCDGSVVNMTVSDGTLTPLTTPNLTGSNRFIRSNTAPGGTGGSSGSHTHAIDPPNTTSTGNNGPTTAMTGAGILVDQNLAGITIHVADTGHVHNLNNHTHDVDIASFTSGPASATILPPYYDLVPFIRL